MTFASTIASSARTIPPRRHRAPLTVAALILLAGCSDGSPQTSSETSGGETTSTPPSSSSSSTGATADSSSSSGVGSASGTLGTSSAGESSGTTTGPFEDPTAFDTDVAIECNTLNQDCPEGERCTPYANDGGDEWTAVRCVPVTTFESTLGEPCEIEGDLRSGIDNCGPGTLCLDVDVDPEMLLLECVAMCVGTPDDFTTPTCADPELTCVIEGTLAACLPSGTEG